MKDVFEGVDAQPLTRLVENEDARVGHERPADECALALPEGENALGAFGDGHAVEENDNLAGTIEIGLL